MRACYQSNFFAGRVSQRNKSVQNNGGYKLCKCNGLEIKYYFIRIFLQQNINKLYSFSFLGYSVPGKCLYLLQTNYKKELWI